MSREQEALSDIELMDVGTELYVNMVNDGGALVERTDMDCWILSEIPLYGGEPQVEGHYNYSQLEEMVKTIFSWT